VLSRPPLAGCARRVKERMMEDEQTYCWDGYSNALSMTGVSVRLWDCWLADEWQSGQLTTTTTIASRC
jgi:hypothetical protein